MNYDEREKQNSEKEVVRQTLKRVALVTIIVNVLLSVVKFVSGVVANSTAMISDSLHSASDVFSTVIVVIGVGISNKEADKSHPYGHERFESISALVLAITLFLTGGGIGISAVKGILFPDATIVAPPQMLAVWVAIISIFVKEIMYHYTKKKAKEISSDALRADAWHHRSDAFSSVAALVGIVASMLGFALGDAIGSIVICIFIIKVSFDIFMESCSKLTDTSADESTIVLMREYIKRVDGVIRIDLIETRLFGNKIYVDVEISADMNLTLNQSHKIAQEIHDVIEEKFDRVKHCMVHVNPFGEEL